MKATMDLTKDTMRVWSTRTRWTGLQRFSGDKKSGRERGGWSVSGRGMISTTMIMITKKMAALGSIPVRTMTMGITSMFTYRFTM